jgi:hypothetical protein
LTATNSKFNRYVDLPPIVATAAEANGQEGAHHPMEIGPPAFRVVSSCNLSFLLAIRRLLSGVSRAFCRRSAQLVRVLASAFWPESFASPASIIGFILSNIDSI